MFNDQSFILMYGMISIDFFVKVLPPVFLFCLPYARRENIRLKAFLLPVFVLVYSVLVTLAGIAAINVPIRHFYFYIQYAALFIGVFLIELAFFNASRSALLFNLLGGFALREIMTFVFYVVYSAVPQLSAIASRSLAYYLLQFVWFAAAYIVCYFTFIKKQNEAADDDIGSRQPTLYFSFGISMFLIAFYLNKNEAIEPGSMMDYLSVIALILFYIVILLMRGGQLRALRSEKELNLEKRVWVEKEKSLRLTAETVNSINIKYHDLKHMVSKLRHGENSIGLAENIESALGAYENTISTGNDTLDMVLTEENLKFSQNGIDFSYMTDGEAISFMSSLDIISLFSNALDNAFEANLQLPGDEREVYLTIRRALDMVSIVVENPYCSNITMQNGLPATIKEDKQYHGFGMKSIRSTVEKYSGNMDISTDDGRFTLKILLPGR